MPRTVPEEKLEHARRLIRAGETTREIARLSGIGVGTVTRLRSDMGLGCTDDRRRNGGRRKLPEPVLIEDRPTPPSAAALRLAVYDPLVARAIRKRMGNQEAEEEE